MINYSSEGISDCLLRFLDQIADDYAYFDFSLFYCAGCSNSLFVIMGKGWSTGSFLHFTYTVPHADVRAGLRTVAHRGALRPLASMQPARTRACCTV